MLDDRKTVGINPIVYKPSCSLEVKLVYMVVNSTIIIHIDLIVYFRKKTIYESPSSEKLTNTRK